MREDKRHCYNKPSVIRWLIAGWECFCKTKLISVLFCSPLVAFGALAYYLLSERDLGLIIYPLLTGFMIVAPLLVTGFQRVARLLLEGKSPGLIDLLLGFREGTPGIWFLIFILSVGYLIWVTDAVVIYLMFFGVNAVPVSSELLLNSDLRGQLSSFMLFSGAMGFGMAAMAFSVSAFSIPLIMHQGESFVSAVYMSVSTVFNNKLLMLRWALVIAILVLLTLFFVLPLLVVVLPVTAYASFAAYHELLVDAG